MAITQQLARAEGTMLDRCRRDVGCLDDLCSFRALSAGDYLDLDWAPALLMAAADAARVPGAMLTALEAAMSGDSEVNPAYRDAPDSVWEHPVSLLRPSRVVEVARELRRLDGVSFLTGSTVSAITAGLASDVRPVDAHEYLSTHFRALLRFYEEAAQKDLGTVMWWD